MTVKEEFGRSFRFPENKKIEFGEASMNVSQRIAVKMAEEYDDLAVAQIVKEAVNEGVTYLTVLNKRSIMNALQRQVPQKPRDDGWLYCPVCGRNLCPAHFNYCPDCGQKIDWEVSDNA